MNGRKNQEQKKKELIEIAAEQFARLFWKQWLYMKESDKSKSLRNDLNKRKSQSFSSPL